MSDCSGSTCEYDGFQNPKIVKYEDTPEGASSNIIFKDGTRIKITETIGPNGERQIQHNFFAYTAPIASFSASPNVFEVGDTVAEVVFTANVTKGSDDISTLSISPDPGVAVTEGTTTFSKLNVTSSVKASVQSHTLTVDDASSEPAVTKTASVNAYFRQYMGFSTKAQLNEADVKALVNSGLTSSIKSTYGGSYTYAFPNNGFNNYLYWAYDLGSPEIQELLEGPLPVPLKLDHPNVSVTNSFGIVKTYRIVRLQNALGTGNKTFTMS